MSFANTEVLPTASGYFLGPVGRTPFNKRGGEESLEKFYKAADVIEKHLLINTFLVGERLTLADLFTASIFQRPFQYILDKKWRSNNPNTTRWFETVTKQPIFTAACPEVVMVDEIIKNIPPPKTEGQESGKKEKAPKEKKEKEAPKPKAAAAKKKDEEEEEEDAPAAPKAKHPLESLGKPTLILDDWKRKYSNEETREVALPWFWDNFKADEYSLWKVDYKYNDELTMTFMTSNLIGPSPSPPLSFPQSPLFTPLTKGITTLANPPFWHLGGFFARLEASRKYLFGCASVFGVTNDSVVKGAFLVRGQEALPAFDVAPDYESYEFSKLDPSKAEDKAFVDDMWAWDKPITVGDKKFEWADGKVFK